MIVLLALGLLCTLVGVIGIYNLGAQSRTINVNLSGDLHIGNGIRVPEGAIVIPARAH